MKSLIIQFVLWCCCRVLLTAPAQAAVARRGDAFVLSSPTYSIAFSAANGSILAVTQRGGGSLFKSGEYGLWQGRWRDDTRLNAADFGTGAADRTFSCDTSAANTLRMSYRSAEIDVLVTVQGRSDGANFTARVTPRKNVLLELALPGRLRFDPVQIIKLVCPANGNDSVGTAFHGSFFGVQPQDPPVGWTQHMIGGQGYAALYGGPLNQRENDDPPTSLNVTTMGHEWLGEALTARVAQTRAVVNRPPTAAQAERTLVNSPNGAYLSANSLGGQGSIWRVGGGVADAEAPLVADMVTAVIAHLAARPPAGRTKIGVLALEHGPERGGWTTVPVADWLAHLRAINNPQVQLVELTNGAMLRDALNANDFLTILNPYGEWCPLLPNTDMPATVEAVRRYVCAGGNWFEVGGYPFFYALTPQQYLEYGTQYPDAFADFLHFATRAGNAALYGVQPQKSVPWAGAKDPAAIFVPGRLACGGDAAGGYAERAFGTYVAPGQTWQSPTVRLLLGQPAGAALQSYCRDNGIRRALADKMSPQLLDKLKRSVLVYVNGNAREKMTHLSQLPVPSLVHFADYLKGGFDKQYPDHLPPNSGFGTPEELRALYDRCHALGLLVMPYTNPTWWCDHPRGPTFQAAGDAPLLRGLDGKLSYEKYNLNDGYTTCPWHPAVQAANRNTVRQFTTEYPSDVLFEDQCGARTWRYDTNPASPTAYAYADGMVSQVIEDAQRVPLGTEAGWDRVVNYESQLCGMSFAIVPTEGAPSWRRLMKTQYPPGTWEVFPVAQYIAHDKAMMLHHDLGQFVTNRQVLSWTLALGFSMSYRLQASALDREPTREWLRWLDRIQKSVCARYIGEPVTAFEHDRAGATTSDDDGVIRATYGPVRIVANLGPKPHPADALPAYGFRAEAPDVMAADAASASCVAEGDARGVEVWVYSDAGHAVDVQLPTATPGGAWPGRVTWDDGTATSLLVRGRSLTLHLPGTTSGPKRLWHAVLRIDTHQSLGTRLR